MMNKFATVDARQKIKGNVKDARQILKNRHSLKTRFSNTGTQDARFKIRAKKFQPIKQELLKIKSASAPARTSSLPGRTIKNKFSSGTRFNKHSKQKPKINTSAPKGLISVSNGKRKLIEKVTLHQTGLKVAIPNEFARSIPISAKDRSLKITLDNPNAVKKPTPTSYRPYKSNSFKEKTVLERPQRSNYYDPIEEELLYSSAAKKSNFENLYAERANYSKPVLTHHAPFDFGLASTSGASSAYHSSNRLQELSQMSNVSPLEGTKILVSNLHPVVVEDDILELFSVIGPLRRARMIGRGKAEVVYVRKNDAIDAYQKYNKRDLDGQPMQMKLELNDELPQSEVNYSWITDIGRKKQGNVVEIEPGLLQRSLFKTSSSSASSQPVVFTVKI